MTELLDTELEAARLWRESELADARGKWLAGGQLRALAHEMELRIKGREEKDAAKNPESAGGLHTDGDETVEAGAEMPAMSGDI